MHRMTRLLGAIGIALTLSPPPASAGSILDTKHNLSLSGPGTIKSATETRVCVFCHAPHNARRDVTPLWNRSDTTVNYTTYQSSTLHAAVGQPTGASKLCLSCHDGTIALGSVLTSAQEIPFAGGIRFLPEGPSRLGTDISDDHPISFRYDAALAASNGELKSPASLTGAVKLDASGELQCTACHDPHDDRNGKFLVMNNRRSALCTTCHDRNGWAAASHASSGASWNGSGANPWPHTPYRTVDDNGCENCHRPHTAGGHARLLNFALEEDNCLVCHDGNVAGSNIENELLKGYGHRVQDYAGIHDPAEDFTSGTVSTHVECVDCHNPHQANADTAVAPDAPGALKGVKGITASGTATASVAYLYEVCFKCHADNNVTTVADISRRHQQLNTRLEFDLGNPSYHPVEGAGKNPDVPSLITPYTVSSVIYCTDCHNNDDGPGNNGSGPRGPHGSDNRFLLERNYTTQDHTKESSFEYALCYKCHSRSNILNDRSFKEHSKHVEGEDAPCSACHDPHGVSATQGSSSNATHLINFDTNIVKPNRSGLLRFEDLGRFRGRCYLSCHGEDHDPKTYP